MGNYEQFVRHIESRFKSCYAHQFSPTIPWGSFTMTRTSQYEIFADYHQFYLQDDDQSFGDLSQAWTEEATDRLLAVAPHVISVGSHHHRESPDC
jgi:hypothetical protein